MEKRITTESLKAQIADEFKELLGNQISNEEAAQAIELCASFVEIVLSFELPPDLVSLLEKKDA